jgi:hypothetical protein
MFYLMTRSKQLNLTRSKSAVGNTVEWIDATVLKTTHHVVVTRDAPFLYGLEIEV